MKKNMKNKCENAVKGRDFQIKKIVRNERLFSYTKSKRKQRRNTCVIIIAMFVLTQSY